MQSFLEKKSKNAGLQYEVEATFRSSNNELISQTTYFSIKAKKPGGKLLCKWRHDTLLIDYQGNDSITTGELFITKQAIYGQRAFDYSEEIIRFPHMVKASPYALHYTVKVGKQFEILEIPEPEFRVEKYQRGDSAFFHLKNTFDWPVEIQLSKGKEILETSRSSADWHWEGLMDKHKPLVLRYSYLVYGSRERRQAYLMHNENRLFVHSDQPEQVEPGDSIDIKITVKDNLGNPVPNVDLTAWASNKHFPSDNVPRITNQKHVQQLWDQRQKINISFPQIDDLESLDIRQVKHLQLDTAEFYRLRYPDSVAFRYIPLKDSNRREFAPFLFENGLQTKLRLIYCDGQLIYFKEAVGQDNFSFLALRDRVDLRLRAGEWTYDLSAIPLKKGFKTEIFINPNRLPHFARKYPQKQRFTEEEKRDLNRSLFYLEDTWGYYDEVYVWQFGKAIRLPERPNMHRDGRQVYCLGPFYLPQIAFAIKNKYGRYLNFKAGYLYTIKQHEVQVEKLPLADFTYPEYSENHYVPQKPGSTIFSSDQLNLHEKNRTNVWTASEANLGEKWGAIVFPKMGEDEWKVYAQQCGDAHNFWPLGTYYNLDQNRLPEGCYTFIFQDDSGKTAGLDSVFIQDDQLLIFEGKKSF